MVLGSHAEEGTWATVHPPSLLTLRFLNVLLPVPGGHWGSGKDLTPWRYIGIEKSTSPVANLEASSL